MVVASLTSQKLSPISQPFKMISESFWKALICCLSRVAMANKSVIALLKTHETGTVGSRLNFGSSSNFEGGGFGHRSISRKAMSSMSWKNCRNSFRFTHPNGRLSSTPIADAIVMTITKIRAFRFMSATTCSSRNNRRTESNRAVASVFVKKVWLSVVNNSRNRLNSARIQLLNRFKLL